MRRAVRRESAPWRCVAHRVARRFRADGTGRDLRAARGHGRPRRPAAGDRRSSASVWRTVSRDPARRAVLRRRRPDGPSPGHRGWASGSALAHPLAVTRARMDPRQRPRRRRDEEEQRLRGGPWRAGCRRHDSCRGSARPAPEAADARGQRRSRALDDARGRGNAVRSAGRAAAAEHPRFCGWDRIDTFASRGTMPTAAACRIRAAVAARRVSIAAPSPAATLVAAIERRPSEPGISRYRVRLPGTRLPIVALDLDVGPGVAGGHVYRRAVVSESRFAGFEAAPVELGRAMLSRVVRDGLTASALRVPIAVPAEAELELTIDDGANEPLDLRAVAVVLAELPWIYFEAPAGAVTAQSGDLTLPQPQYDLEAVRSSVDLAKVPEAKWGDGETARERRRWPERRRRSRRAPEPRSIPRDSGTPALSSRRSKAATRPSVSWRFRSTRMRWHTAAARRHGSPTSACSTVPTSRFPTCSSAATSHSRLMSPLVQAPDSRAQELKMPPGSRQRSVYVVALPYANLPASSLVLETSGRVFQRTVRIGVDRPPDRQRRDAYFDVRAAETWRHADEQTPARPLTLQRRDDDGDGARAGRR